MNLSSNTSSANPAEIAAMRHWAARRREILMEDRLDNLVAVLEKLVAVLERRTS